MSWFKKNPHILKGRISSPKKTLNNQGPVSLPRPIKRQISGTGKTPSSSRSHQPPVFADVFQCFFCYFLGWGEVNRTGAPFLMAENQWVGFLFHPYEWLIELMIGRCNFLLVGPSFQGDMLVSEKVASKCRSEQVHRIVVWKELEYPWVFSFSLAGGVGTFALFPGV